MQNNTRKILPGAGGVNCPIRYALSMVGGKWKLQVICLLSRQSPARYGYIKKMLPGITPMMLSQTLKELEANHLLERKQYNQIPPKVEYSLTPKGESLMPVLDVLSDWGKTYLGQAKDCDVECGKVVL